MSGAYFLPPVPVEVAPNESEERDFDNTSPDLMMMANNFNVFDDRPKTNNILNEVRRNQGGFRVIYGILTR